MSKCPACGSIYLEHWKEYIFTNNHEWINCTNCDNLWIKRLDNKEWIESSSTNCQKHVYDESVKHSQKEKAWASNRQTHKVRSVALKVAKL